MDKNKEKEPTDAYADPDNDQVPPQKQKQGQR